MDGYSTSASLTRESLLFIVTSTFGNGDPPDNGTTFYKELLSLKNNLKQSSIGPKFGGKFAVFALGSTAYPHFCAFGKKVDALLAELGGIRIHRVGLGDEQSSQEAAFDEWAVEVFAQACEVFSIVNPFQGGKTTATFGYDKLIRKKSSAKSAPWSKENVKLIEFKEDQNGVVGSNDLQKMLPKVERIEQGMLIVFNLTQTLKQTFKLQYLVSQTESRKLCVFDCSNENV